MRNPAAAGIAHGIETEQTKVLIEFIFIKMLSQQTPTHKPKKYMCATESWLPRPCWRLFAFFLAVVYVLLFFYAE